MIPRVLLGKTGLEVGRLGLGTWELGEQNIPVGTVQKMISSLLEVGGNVIDSDNYDGAENIIGQAIQKFNRQDLILVTKCGDYTRQTFDLESGLSTNSPNYKYFHLNFTPEVIKRNIEDSLRSLRTDYLDVVLIHTCYMDTLHQGQVIDALISAQKEGKIRYIGYSDRVADSFLVAQNNISQYSGGKVWLGLE